MKKLAAFIFAAFLLTGAAKAKPETYILLEQDGFINVFEESNLNCPTIKTGIRVRFLPEADQVALKDGLHVSGDENLLSLLEDLGS